MANGAAEAVVSSQDALVRAEQAARSSYGRILALLVSWTGDVQRAEDALSDAFERALRTWPEQVPANPDAWLLTAARNRLRDHWGSAEVRRTAPLDIERDAPAVEDEIDPDAIPDRRLALLLVCGHPAIAAGDRTPLMLNTVLGYTAAQVAAAYAVPRRTMATRLVRAKRRVKANRIPFRIPDRHALPARMDAVLEAIYGALSIDWRGAEELGPGSLAETVAQLAPQDAEARGLAALAALLAAGAPARSGEEFVPLDQQDSRSWDHVLITRAKAHLARAHEAGEPGRFQLEATIALLHRTRDPGAEPDWPTVLGLYDALVAIVPSLGARIARATVVGRVHGPRAGLAALDEIGTQADAMQAAWAARGHLQWSAGDRPAAAQSLERAAEMSSDERERRYLRQRGTMARCCSTRSCP